MGYKKIQCYGEKKFINKKKVSKNWNDFDWKIKYSKRKNKIDFFVDKDKFWQELF